MMTGNGNADALESAEICVSDVLSIENAVSLYNGEL